MFHPPWLFSQKPIQDKRVRQAMRYLHWMLHISCSHFLTKTCFYLHSNYSIDEEKHGYQKRNIGESLRGIEEDRLRHWDKTIHTLSPSPDPSVTNQWVVAEVTSHISLTHCQLVNLYMFLACIHASTPAVLFLYSVNQALYWQVEQMPSLQEECLITWLIRL